MRFFVVVVAALCAFAQGASAQQITAAECRAMDTSFAGATAQLRRMVETYPHLARAMAVVIEKGDGRPQLQATAVQVGVQIASAMASQERLLAALEDLQHQFRLCGRE